MLYISAFDSDVNNGAVPFVFKMSVVIGLYVPSLMCVEVPLVGRQVHLIPPELLNKQQLR